MGKGGGEGEKEGVRGGRVEGEGKGRGKRREGRVKDLHMVNRVPDGLSISSEPSHLPEDRY